MRVADQSAATAWRHARAGFRASVCACLLSSGLLLGSVLSVPVPTTATPIAIGRVEYRVSWNGIPAAAATIEVKRGEQAGEPVYRVEAAMRTSRLVDLLWRRGARAASSFTSADLVPLGFQYDREENSKHSVTDVSFSRSAPQATGVYRRGSDTKVLDVQAPGLLDPITAIFRALAQPIKVGDLLHYEVFTGEARYRVELAITGEDTVAVAGGTYRAWRVDPRVWKLGTGVDKRLRHATLWVSKDPTHVLLRLQSEVFIGVVNCDLVDVQGVADRS
jgi:hypothetical protein